MLRSVGILTPGTTDRLRGLTVTSTPACSELALTPQTVLLLLNNLSRQKLGRAQSPGLCLVPGTHAPSQEGLSFGTDPTLYSLYTFSGPLPYDEGPWLYVGITV